MGIARRPSPPGGCTVKVKRVFLARDVVDDVWENGFEFRPVGVDFAQFFVSPTAVGRTFGLTAIADDTSFIVAVNTRRMRHI